VLGQLFVVQELEREPADPHGLRDVRRVQCASSRRALR
jgi:hypothetical protein